MTDNATTIIRCKVCYREAEQGIKKKNSNHKKPANVFDQKHTLPRPYVEPCNANSLLLLRHQYYSSFLPSIYYFIAVATPSPPPQSHLAPCRSQPRPTFSRHLLRTTAAWTATTSSLPLGKLPARLGIAGPLVARLELVRGRVQVSTCSVAVRLEPSASAAWVLIGTAASATRRATSACYRDAGPLLLLLLLLGLILLALGKWLLGARLLDGGLWEGRLLADLDRRLLLLLLQRRRCLSRLLCRSEGITSRWCWLWRDTSCKRVLRWRTRRGSRGCWGGLCGLRVGTVCG